VDVHAYRSQTFGHPIRYPRARLACVLANHGLRLRRGAHQVVAQSAAYQVRALFSERKFSRHTANTVGPEQLPLLAHKRMQKNSRNKSRTARTEDDKREWGKFEIDETES
jgi:hypothetical protein